MCEPGKNRGAGWVYISLSEQSSYERKGERNSMVLLQPVGIHPSHTKSHHFPPLSKSPTRVNGRPPPRLPTRVQSCRVPPGHALHASDERTRHACSCSYCDGYEDATPLLLLSKKPPESYQKGRADGKKKKMKNRGGACRAVSSMASVVYITEQASRGRGR